MNLPRVYLPASQYTANSNNHRFEPRMMNIATSSELLFLYDMNKSSHGDQLKVMIRCGVLSPICVAEQKRKDEMQHIPVIGDYLLSSDFSLSLSVFDEYHGFPSALFRTRKTAINSRHIQPTENSDCLRNNNSSFIT